MQKLFLRAARRWFLVFVPVLLAVIIVPAAAVRAADGGTETKFMLTVEPVDCTVDLVQNGSGQILQIPAHSCLPVAPTLLTPVLSQDPEQPAAPGADDGQSDEFDVHPVAAIPVVVTQAAPKAAPLESLASVAPSAQGSPAQPLDTMTTVAVGVGVSAAVTALGLDMALFEMSHSKSAVRWARSRLGIHLNSLR